MVPAALVGMEWLPLTASGKVDRRALAALEVDFGAEAGVERVPPRTPTEQTLADVWRDLLRLEQVGVRDDFFRLGGHSLLATQVVSRVRRLLGAEIGVRAVFEAPTIEGLARLIDDILPERPGSNPPALARRGRSEGELLPLSFPQRRLWFLDRLQPGASVYNMPMAYRLRGALDPAALAAAVGELARRHESLRTRFATADDEPFQVVSPPGPVPVPLVDLTGLVAEEAEREGLALGAVEALRPFDLERGPLFRVSLFRLEERDWILLLAMHHIVSDGWSMGVLWRDLEALYTAAATGEAVSLPAPALRYSDYAAWQREWLEGDGVEGDLVYWRERLAGSAPLLELPTDRPRPAEQTYRGAWESFTVGGPAAGRLRRLSRESGAALFMTAQIGRAHV
jgi:hypothetical protein